MSLNCIFWQPFILDLPSWYASQIRVLADTPVTSQMSESRAEYPSTATRYHPTNQRSNEGHLAGGVGGLTSTGRRPWAEPELEVRKRRLIFIAAWFCPQITFSIHWDVNLDGSMFSTCFVTAGGAKEAKMEKGQLGANEREATKVRQNSTRPSRGEA